MLQLDKGDRGKAPHTPTLLSSRKKENQNLLGSHLQ